MLDQSDRDKSGVIMPIKIGSRNSFPDLAGVVLVKSALRYILCRKERK